ncbi:MAG: outer membrane beta-barrel protein [Saprospiraceae bacterium]
MKTLKTVFFILLAAVGLNAQGLILEGGINFNSLNGTSEFGNEVTGTSLGFQIGLLKSISLSESLYLKPGIKAQLKGGKDKVTFELFGQEITSKFNIDIYNLEIPIMLGFKAPVFNGNIFVEAGPAISANLFAQSRIKTTENGTTEKESEKITIGNEEGDLRLLEVAVIGGLGYEWSKFSGALRFQQGLTNLVNDDESTLKSRVISIVFGYRFGG